MATSREKVLLKQSAAALRTMKTRLEEEMEKKASAEAKHNTYVETQERLFKLASKDVLQYEDIPSFTEKLASMDEDERKLELLSLEKAASLNFLRVGNVDESKDDFADSDPLSAFIMNNTLY